MYIVKLHNYHQDKNLEWVSIWPECFSSMKAAVRFGMRAYRKWEEVVDFRVEKIDKRDKFAEKMW